MPAFIPISNPIAMFLRSLLGLSNETRRASLLWVLAIATEKNIPLTSALDALAEESTGNWQHRVQDFTALVEEGTPLAEAAAAVSGLLSTETIMIIRSAAESGTLVQALRTEAERISTENEFSNGRQFIQTVAYIVAVMMLTMAIVSFIMVYIIPKFKKIFEDFGVELPKLTLTIIDISDAALSLWFLAMPVGLLLCGGIMWLFVRSYAAGSIMSVLAGIIPRTGVGSLLRGLSHVVDAGKPLAPAISSMANHHPSQAVYRKMSAVYEDVDAGDNCWESMQHHGLLRKREVALIRSAEHAGNAGWALRQIGQDLDRRFRNRLEMFVQLLRPAVMLAVGVAVGYIVISLFLPILKLINDLS